MNGCETINQLKPEELKQKLLLLAKDDLEQIEEKLKACLDPPVKVVADIAGHLLFAGGKRIRPLLAILSARLCGYEGDSDLSIAGAIEYLHAATLLHDDVVDGAKMRRGKPVANSIWNGTMAVLTGDFLFAKAACIASEIEESSETNIAILKIVSNVVGKMAQGEIWQQMNKGRLDTTEQEYFDIIYYKTGAMIEAACRTGALLAEVSEEKVEALTTFGNRLGTVFQMVDDLLDYSSDIKNFGKKCGVDLLEGKLTLPVIHALKNANNEDYIYMEKIIGSKDFTIEEFEKFKGLLIKYKGLEYTKRLAEEYIIEAISALSIFNDSETKRILIIIAQYFLHREH